MRIIGMDIHRVFAGAVVLEDGEERGCRSASPGELSTRTAAQERRHRRQNSSEPAGARAVPHFHTANCATSAAFGLAQLRELKTRGGS